MKINEARKGARSTFGMYTYSVVEYFSPFAYWENYQLSQIVHVESEMLAAVAVKDATGIFRKMAPCTLV
jgi:hypothetical protein